MKQDQQSVRIGVLGTARVVPYALLEPSKNMPGIRVTAVASRQLARAREFSRRHDIPIAIEGYDALLSCADVDAIYVALPTGLHAHWSRMALESGKHVLCEKPLTTTAESSRAVLALAQTQRLVLEEAMHLRFLRKLQRQCQLVASGDFGAVRRVESCFRHPNIEMKDDDFRLETTFGGGAGLDLGCYAVNCLHMVTGEVAEIKSVRCEYLATGVDCWMRAEIALPCGAEGAIECGFAGTYRPRFDVSITCEHGWIRWHREGLLAQLHGTLTYEPTGPERTYDLQLEAFALSITHAATWHPRIDVIATAEVVDAMYAKAGMFLSSQANR